MAGWPSNTGPKYVPGASRAECRQEAFEILRGDSPAHLQRTIARAKKTAVFTPVESWAMAEAARHLLAAMAPTRPARSRSSHARRPGHRRRVASRGGDSGDDPGGGDGDPAVARGLRVHHRDVGGRR